VTPHTTIEQQHWISVNVMLVYFIFCSKAIVGDSSCCWPQMGQTKGEVSAS